MSLWIALLLFCLGAALIIKGGDLFVEAAVGLAEALGLPKFVIGATVVSLATTLPEIMVSLMAALDGQTELAIGNAVGSVSANTGLILGLSLCCMPMGISRRLFGVRGLILVLSCGSLWLLSRDGLTLPESAVLLLLLAAYLAETLRGTPRTAGQPRGAAARFGPTLLGFAAGAAMLVAGSRLLVDNGTRLAEALAVPERVIAVTMVAVGTSLPELVTAVTAMVKGHGSLSAGNILGANIIDLTLILPLCALACRGTLPVSGVSLALDLPICTLLAAIAVIPALLGGKLSRLQGFGLLAVYGAYVAAAIL